MANNDYIEFGDGTRLYRINADDEWRNSAYDEEGESAVCELCDGELRWNGYDGYVCKECGHEMSRSDYLNYIGANPPDGQCYHCSTNYPFCKKECVLVSIDPFDPMLT